MSKYRDISTFSQVGKLQSGRSTQLSNGQGREEGFGKKPSGLAGTKPQDDWGGCWGLVNGLSHLAQAGQECPLG